MAAFGFRFPAWHTVDFYEAPSIGRLPRDNARFDPDDWKPRVPNPAFLRARADDKFWAAQKLVAMSDDLLRAAVKAGELGDPRPRNFSSRPWASDATRLRKRTNRLWAPGFGLGAALPISKA